MNNNLENLKILKELLDMGAITKEEYDKKKVQILGLHDDNKEKFEVDNHGSVNNDLQNLSSRDIEEKNNQDIDESNIKKPKSKLKIAGLAILAVFVVLFLLAVFSKPEFWIDFDDDYISMKAGQTKKVEVYFDDDRNFDLSNCAFTSDDDNVASVSPDGTITAKEAGTTYINAFYLGKGTDEEKKEKLKKLSKKLDNGDDPRFADTVEVKVKPSPQQINNGQIIEAPLGEADIPFKVSVPNEKNVYVYLKGIDSNNNIGFYVAKGQSAEVNVPAGKYKAYYAIGETWYGDYYYFGKNTEYYKGNGTLNFYYDYANNQSVGYQLELTYDTNNRNNKMKSTNKKGFQKAIE